MDCYIQPDVESTGGGALKLLELPVNGISRINDSKTYGPVDDVKEIVNLVLQAKSAQRPYIRLEQDWVLSSAANSNAQLTLDGYGSVRKET